MTTQTQPETLDSIIAKTTLLLLDIEADMGAENVYTDDSASEDKSATDHELSMDAAVNNFRAHLVDAISAAETVVASVQAARGIGERRYTEAERAEIGRTTAQLLAHLRVLTRAYTETDEPTGFAEVMAELDDLAR